MGKKRKNYYSDFKDSKRWKGILSTGMKGFLCTYNMRVKECIREAYNLLNDFADQMQGPEENEEPNGSIEDELERELKGMRKKPSEKMFQVVETGAENTVFIKTMIEDPVKLTDEIFRVIFTTKQSRSRFLLRLVPIQVTCKAYIEDIRKAADQMFDAPFQRNPVTFNVFYKSRYNNSVLRDEVLKAMVTLVKDRNPSHKVDLTKPRKTVIVEIIKGVCCLSVVDDFYKYRKFNLLEAAKVDDEPGKREAETAPGSVEVDDTKLEPGSSAVAMPGTGIEDVVHPDVDDEASKRDAETAPGSVEVDDTKLEPGSSAGVMLRTAIENVVNPDVDDESCKREVETSPGSVEVVKLTPDFGSNSLDKLDKNENSTNDS